MRLRLAVAGLIVGLGLIAAPVAAQADPIHIGESGGITVNPPSGVPATNSLVTVCLTVRELNFGPACLHIP
jgi:hypothetical protein